MSPIQDPYLAELSRFILRLHLDISSGKNKATARQDLYRELKDHAKTELADLLLTYDAVLGERPEMSINIHGGNFANVSFGDQIGTINATLNVLEGQSPEAKDAAGRISLITEAIASDLALDDKGKRDALQALEFIAKQAEMPKHERNEGMLTSIMESVPKIISAAPGLVTLWHSVGPHLIQFFEFVSGKISN